MKKEVEETWRNQEQDPLTPVTRALVTEERRKWNQEEDQGHHHHHHHLHPHIADQEADLEEGRRKRKGRKKKKGKENPSQHILTGKKKH